MKKIGIVITIPKTVKWEEYEKELDVVKDWNQVMNFKVSNTPKNLEIGSRVYLCYNGNIIGWQTFVGTYHGEFTCTTTDKEWKGCFIQRSGPFHYLKTPIPCNGFRGFKYINYSINENQNTVKTLITESDSINVKLQNEAIKLLDTIKGKLNGTKKQIITEPITIFNKPITLKCLIYNKNSVADYISFINQTNVENYFDYGNNTMYITLFFINNESVDDNNETIAHELSHIFQSMLTDTKLPVSDINKELHKYLNSKNIYRQKLAYMLYLSDSNEQDAIIQGFESLLNGKTMEEINIIYENSYVNECINTLSQLIKQFIKYKDKFIIAVNDYSKYNLNYQRVLNRAKNSLKRIKLKVGHILSAHKNENQNTPNIEKIKEIITK